MPPLLGMGMVFFLACLAPPHPTPPPPFQGLSPRPEHSALALGLSAPDFGLTTLWLELHPDTPPRILVLDGLRLLTDAGPRHQQEIAARADRQCTLDRTQTCALLIAEITDGTGPAAAASARQALLARAAREVRCFDEHTLERIQSVTPTRRTLALATSSTPCAEPSADAGAGYDEQSYATEAWGEGRLPPPLSAEILAALHREVTEVYPHLSDQFDPERVALVQERAAGIARSRAALFLQDGIDSIEVSVTISEHPEPVDFAALLTRWPDATDVLLSPGQSTALLLRETGLVGVQVADARVLWELPLEGRIVMAEWAQGAAAVARWEAAIMPTGSGAAAP